MLYEYGHCYTVDVENNYVTCENDISRYQKKNIVDDNDSTSAVQLTKLATGIHK